MTCNNGVINTGCVCISDETKKMFNNRGFVKEVPMSNGLLDNKKYYNLFLEKNFDFKICYETSYVSFCDNQAMFLEDYRKANLKIIDWRDAYSSYFPNSNIEYGNPNGLKLMIPLQDDLGYF